MPAICKILNCGPGLSKITSIFIVLGTVKVLMIRVNGNSITSDTRQMLKL